MPMCVLFFIDINYVCFPLLLLEGSRKSILGYDYCFLIQRHHIKEIYETKHGGDYEDCCLLEYVCSFVDRYQHFTRHDYFNRMFKNITKKYITMQECRVNLP
jgi:hypothetical protein